MLPKRTLQSGPVVKRKLLFSLNKLAGKERNLLLAVGAESLFSIFSNTGFDCYVKSVFVHMTEIQVYLQFMINTNKNKGPKCFRYQITMATQLFHHTELTAKARSCTVSEIRACPHELE